MIDIEKTIYEAVAAIEAYAPFTALDPPVRLVTDEQAGAAMKRKIYRLPADFPQLRIEMGGGTRMQNAPRSFGHNSTSYTSATCNHVMPSTVDVNLIGIYDTNDLAKQQQLETVVDQFLNSKWPKFGITWLASFAVRKLRRRETSPMTNNVERTVTRWVVTFNARPMLSQVAS